MAALISLSSSLASRAIFLPLQISQQYNQFKVPRRNSAKILTFKATETLQNGITNAHYLRANPCVHSTKLGNATSGNINSNILNQMDEPEEEEKDLEYYSPKMGDLVAGVVVSRQENRLQINIGSERLACMYLNEFYPINHPETVRISCEMPAEINTEGKSESTSAAAASVDDDCDRFVDGRMGILMDKGAPTSSVIEEGTVLYAEVLGHALSGEPLLSSRLSARKIAWQRLRQIKHENKPIEIYIIEWNTGGLVSRIEGLRGFLPKCEMLNTPFDDFAVLQEYVGTRMEVIIIDVIEELGNLIVSEKRAWEMRNFYEGNLLQGTITRIYSYGAQVNVDGTCISGLLHISKMSREKVSLVTHLFSKGEKVKVMVVRSNSPYTHSFSIADLESEKGLILSNKE
ncbi:hypothetical protein KI387_015407, partial [Taxus chinensis]